VVLARLICFIPSESNKYLISAELKHGFEMPKSHIPIIPAQFLGRWPIWDALSNGLAAN
jgi:hypothetical protein